MKIEKISDNQIRCTLTREDLASRKIRLSELAYGSDKAKELFRDMMMEASREYGFEADNTPLMIEAVPVSTDAIILIITKVDDPEELDSRFSRFSQEDNPPENTSMPSISEAMSGIDDILNLISKLSHAKKAAAANQKQETGTPTPAENTAAQVKTADVSGQDQIFNITRFFLFSDLESVIHAAKRLEENYEGPNSLYKNPTDLNYYLILRKAETDAAQFNRICNLLTEYGLSVDYTEGLEELFIEHMQIISSGSALQTLRQL